ncbi:MAG: fumarylacetoacetate hydrolase family protein [Haloarculaceae archaeon]
MRFVRFQTAGTTGFGVSDGDRIHVVETDVAAQPPLETVANASARRAIRRRIDRDALPTVPLADARLLAPVGRPGQVVCVGLNYHDHAEEQNEEVPDAPLLFAKSPTAVVGPGDPIVHPATVDQVDYEVELAIVVGRTARNVAATDAEEYIAGYTVVNDVSARDAQFDDGQFFRGKSYETFAPMGPALVRGDGFDPNDASVALHVDGERKQHSSTAEFIFDVHEVFEYVSGVTTLRPGDVIPTGTPGGVGIFRDPPDLLEPGDTVEATVDGIGTLRNPVVAETDAA